MSEMNQKPEPEASIYTKSGICSKCNDAVHEVCALCGRCDACGGDTYQRDDDREETVRRRLQVYIDQTAPLIDFYAARGLLRQVEGTGEITDIFQRITRTLSA